MGISVLHVVATTRNWKACQTADGRPPKAWKLIKDALKTRLVKFTYQGQVPKTSWTINMGVDLMLSGIVGATPTFQKFNITRMSVAWIKWAWKLNYNTHIFQKVPPLAINQQS